MNGGGLRRLALVSMLIAGGGCSIIHTRTPEGQSVAMDEKGFANYVEQVFRHHNSVVNDLLFVSGEQADRNSPLGQAEASMAHACLPLNEVVSAAALGQSAGFWERMTLSEAVPECEAATRAVESMIRRGK